MRDRRVASLLSCLSGCHLTLEIGRRRVMVPEYEEEGVCRVTNIRNDLFLLAEESLRCLPSLGPSSVHFNLY